jgi:hypothetical protein
MTYHAVPGINLSVTLNLKQTAAAYWLELYDSHQMSSKWSEKPYPMIQDYRHERLVTIN